jgi:hypothetical protein
MTGELEAIRKIIKRYYINAADNMTEGHYDKKSLEEHLSIAATDSWIVIEREKYKFIEENQKDETDGEFAF